MKAYEKFTSQEIKHVREKKHLSDTETNQCGNEYTRRKETEYKTKRKLKLIYK